METDSLNHFLPFPFNQKATQMSVRMKLGSRAREFPVIKKVSTFIVEGVGSGGDYHNVRYVCCSLVG